MGKESCEDTAMTGRLLQPLQAPRLTHLGLSASLRASPHHWAPEKLPAVGSDLGQ